MYNLFSAEYRKHFPAWAGRARRAVIFLFNLKIIRFPLFTHKCAPIYRVVDEGKNAKNTEKVIYRVTTHPETAPPGRTVRVRTSRDRRACLLRSVTCSYVV